MNAIEILNCLANMPIHSPEWLENPSVRVELIAMVHAARKIKGEKMSLDYLATIQPEEIYVPEITD